MPFSKSCQINWLIDQIAKVVNKMNFLQKKILASKHPDAQGDSTRVAEVSFKLGYEHRLLIDHEREELNALHKKYKDYIANSPNF